jgi:hypothetical protein
VGDEVSFQPQADEEKKMSNEVNNPDPIPASEYPTLQQFTGSAPNFTASVGMFRPAAPV